MKQCTKCKEWKELAEFSKRKESKDGHRSQCKQCVSKSKKYYYIKNKEQIKEYKKEWCENNKEQIKEYQKEWRENNKEQIKEWRENNKEQIKERSKEWRENNKDHIKEYIKEYRGNNKEQIKDQIKEYSKSNAKYELYKDKLTIDESPRLNENGISIEVKCRYCGKYFIPTISQIQHRTYALNGQTPGEHSLYCSNGCKESCPIYNQSKWPKGHKPATSREVQPELRQMVLLRDNYECQECGSTESLHCHHIWPLNESPITSADVDECVTLCKSCHKWVHMNVDGCGYGEMREYDCDILT